MNRFDELVNNYCLLGDGGEIIFSSFDRFIEFVEEIRADEREACAVACEALRDEDGYESWGTECAAAIRERVIDAAKVGEVGVWGER